MKKLLHILLLSIASTICLSQEYREMIMDPTVNFYDIQKSANTYFSTHDKGKGSGYKQYKRWEYHTEDRVYPGGDRSKITSDYTFNAFRTYKVGKNTDKSLQVTSDWQELGPASWSYSGGWNPGVGRVNSILVDPADSSIILCGNPNRWVVEINQQRTKLGVIDRKPCRAGLFGHCH